MERKAGPVETGLIARLVRATRAELAKERAYLLPLRLFIGLGWIRAAVAKLIDPGWYDGSELTSFLESQLAWSEEAFPFYGTFMETVLLPNAAVLGVLVIALQIVAGLTIAAGFYTSAGLLVANFLNANFILAGVPDPSAFYIVIQLVLFYGNAGLVLGFDGRQNRRHSHPLLVSSVDQRPEHVGSLRRVYALLAAFYGVLALVMAPLVTSLDPGTVVEDPAVILVTLALFAAAAAAIRSIGYGQQLGLGTPGRSDDGSAATGARGT